jgi:hypothetical protein
MLTVVYNDNTTYSIWSTKTPTQYTKLNCFTNESSGMFAGAAEANLETCVWVGPAMDSNGTAFDGDNNSINFSLSKVKSISITDAK